MLRPSDQVRSPVPEALEPAQGFLNEFREKDGPEFEAIRDDVVQIAEANPEKIAVFAAMWMALGSLQSPQEKLDIWKERAAGTEHIFSIGELEHQTGYLLVLDSL